MMHLMRIVIQIMHLLDTKKNEKKDEALTRMDKAINDFRINLEPSSCVNLNQPLDKVIGDVTEPMKTRHRVRNKINYL